MDTANSPVNPAVRHVGLVARALPFVGLAAWFGLVALCWWGLLHLLPMSLTLSLAGRSITTDSVHEYLNSAALIGILLPSALWVEALVTGWKDSSARQLLLDRTPSLNSDLACFLLGQAHIMDLVARVVLLGVTIVSGVWVNEWIAAQTGVKIGPPDWPTPVLVVVFYFVYTFFDYWTHRLDHTPRFWPLHRYHHSAEDFGVITSGRQHPAAFTAIFVINLPMGILGAPPDVMIYVNVLVTGIGFLIHSKMDADWGWFGRWVIQSPNHHRAHHKLDMTHPTGHFGQAAIWDRLFGTWYEDKPDPKLAIGVDTPYAHGLFIPRDMARDYAHFWMGWLGMKSDGPTSDIVLFRRRKAAGPETST